MGLPHLRYAIFPYLWILFVAKARVCFLYFRQKILFLGDDDDRREALTRKHGDVLSLAEFIGHWFPQGTLAEEPLFLGISVFPAWRALT